MKKVQFDPLVVFEVEEAVFHEPLHSQTYYEFAFIKSGRGTHILNENRLTYVENDLFLISPEDHHYFEVDQQTHFVFVLFTDSLLQELHEGQLNVPATFTPENTMRLKLWKTIKLPFDTDFSQVIRHTILGIVAFKSCVKGRHSDWLNYQLLSVFGMIRTLSLQYNAQEIRAVPRKELLIAYINQHIDQPQMIQRKLVADYFNIAESYFSTYFKRNFNMNFSDYVQRYRLKMVEKRLLNSSLSVKRIAAELGFTDASHLTRFFKKHVGMTPSVYRKQQGSRPE